MTKIISRTDLAADLPAVLIINEDTDLRALQIPSFIEDVIRKSVADKTHIVPTNTNDQFRFFAYVNKTKDPYRQQEWVRAIGAESVKAFNRFGVSDVQVKNYTSIDGAEAYFAEGCALGNYQFLKYKSGNTSFKTNRLQQIQAVTTNPSVIEELSNTIESVYTTRDLVNEPLSFLTAGQFGIEIQEAGKKYGFSVESWDKERIEKEKMGGLLAVNRGSLDPPTFNILEWKPAQATNSKPIVLVGKGIVFDTGGLSLKPTANSMDHMKCDMAGASAVLGTLCAVSANKVPLHIIGLIPATDNRPGVNAYAPSDVVHMHSGKTVEVLNTDAEGRMILADALSYAKGYDPELVIDLATLTGSALMAVGPQAAALMGNAGDEFKNPLKKAGFEVYERLVEFPLWDEYDEYLKSPVADIKNIGGRFAGAITAGKFLQHFIDYPWIHLDIAPVAWAYEKSAYRLNGATGAGVRLLYNFFKNHYKAQ